MTAPLVDDTFTLADGRTLAWAEYGKADGAPLIFFHGLPSSRLFAGTLAADAEGLGLRIIAPDRPGFGGSTPAPGRTFVSWADDVRALADHLGLNHFYVAGISGGGPYALVVAHQLRGHVRAAGVISGGGDMSEPGALDGMHDQNRMLFELARSGGAAAIVEAMAPMVEMMKSAPDAALDASLDALPDADKEILQRRPDIKDAMRDDAMEAIRQGVAGTADEVALFVQPWGFDVREITVPVVIWHGDDDRNAPLAHAQALADKIPNAELIVWTGMGHLTSIERGRDVLSHLVESGT
jgi:pimeloyl-ACP methyl ester carboxylesterase